MFSDSSIFDLIDIFSWHFFLLENHRENIPFRFWQEPISRWVDYFRGFLPKGFPMWITEFGIPTRKPNSEFLYSRTRGRIVGLDDREQAEWFDAFAEKAERDWGIELLVWLQLADRPDPTHYYSNSTDILHADATPKSVKQVIANRLKSLK